MKPGQKGIVRIISAFKNSIRGIRDAFCFEAAFREETYFAAIAIPLGFYLAHNNIELILLVGSIILLMAVEILNSAIEAVVDRVGAEYHELSGRAKDMASAAVLFAIILVLLVWVSLLYPHYF